MAVNPTEQAANARAALESLPPDELRARKVKAASVSAVARRQARDEAIVVKIQPAHLLSPAQVVAWRRLWAVLLDPAGSLDHPEFTADVAGNGDVR